MSKRLVINAIRKIPALRNAIWRVRSSVHALERHILVRRPVIDGNPLIENAIARAIPFAAGKLGSIEAISLRTYMKRERARIRSWNIPPYNSYNFNALYVNAGVFPRDEKVFDQFGEIFLEAVKRCDALAAWDVAGEARILQSYCPAATLLKLRTLDPYFSNAPWSRALKDKRVLVISPFTESILKQYSKREQLWDNDEILPTFNLLTLRAPLSPALVAPQDSDWFTATDRLKAKMDAINYDVALVGAGAFSIPLAAHAKNNMKVGIHLGGCLQILFGILGKRWRENKDFKSLIKSSWCSPSVNETPNNINAVEGGCYW